MNRPMPEPTAKTRDWGMARASHWRIPKIDRKKKIHLSVRTRTSMKRQKQIVRDRVSYTRKCIHCHA